LLAPWAWQALQQMGKEAFARVISAACGMQHVICYEVVGSSMQMG
jgi:hypothetical protein